MNSRSSVRIGHRPMGLLIAAEIWAEIGATLPDSPNRLYQFVPTPSISFAFINSARMPCLTSL